MKLDFHFAKSTLPWLCSIRCSRYSINQSVHSICQKNASWHYSAGPVQPKQSFYAHTSELNTRNDSARICLKHHHRRHDDTDGSQYPMWVGRKGHSSGRGWLEPMILPKRVFRGLVSDNVIVREHL